MKKRLLKLSKIIASCLVLLILLIVVGYFWPMPTLEPPKKHDTVVITSINIIDIKTGNVLRNRNVTIQGNMIHSIDSLEVPHEDLNSFVIDGSNKYLIPGLWDMHTHSNQQSEWLHHPLYIANGVTGVRDMSGQLDQRDSYWVGSKERLRWNKELSQYKRVTPRYVLQSSYQIDGASSVPKGFPDYFKLQKPEQVDSLLQFYQNERVDFIKIYQQIPKASYLELAAKVENYGMHIAGHKPMFLSLKESILAGQRSFEHGRIFLFESFPETDSLKNPVHWKTYFSKNKKKLVTDHDPKIAVKLMQLMHEHNTYWVPTIQTLKFEAYAHDPDFLSNSNLDYITTLRKKLWWSFDISNNAKKNTAKETKGVSNDFYELARKQIKLAHDIGVPIMTGTDVTDSYTFAGFSLHEELKEFTQCGLTNLEALQSATLIPAQYAEKEHLFGSVEQGKTADILILNHNPLEDISHTSDIDGVVMGGLYYNSEKIEELKDFTKSMASSFHVNVKVFFSFVNSPLIRVQFAD